MDKSLQANGKAKLLFYGNVKAEGIFENDKMEGEWRC